MSRRLPKPDPAGPGRESVWDYPRPPVLVRDARTVRIEFSGQVIALTDSAYRCLETGNPPCFYLAPAQVRTDLLIQQPNTSFCEWKGHASYWNLELEERVIEGAAWSYADPAPEFQAIRDYVAFFASGLDCTVDGLRVTPQSGDVYGGWITPELAGPFKGDPGSEWW